MYDIKTEGVEKYIITHPDNNGPAVNIIEADEVFKDDTLGSWIFKADGVVVAAINSPASWATSKALS